LKKTKKKKKREREGEELCDDDPKKEIKSKNKTHLLRAMLLPLLSKNLFRCC